MAISYVGGQTTTFAGSTSGTPNTVTFALTGGLAAVPAAGDLVVISYGVGSQGRNQTLAITGYTNLTQLNASAVTQDVSQVVAYKIMGGTPDTTVAIVQSGNISDGGAVTIQVFRGVDATTPLDVTSTTATGTATGRFDPASITPVSGGSWIVVAGASGAATGAVHTAPADFAGVWLSVNIAASNDCTASMGFHSHHTGGAYDPAAISAGGTTGANDSWTAYTLALRPAVVTGRAVQTLGDIGSETTWLFAGSRPSGVTVTSSPVGYAKNKSLYLQKFAANAGRITDLGLMVEPAATNVVPNSANVGQTSAGWAFAIAALGTDPTTAALTADPMGVIDRVRDVEDSAVTSAAHYVQRVTSVTTNQTSMVVSAYVKPSEYGFAAIGLRGSSTNGQYWIFNLSTGAMVKASSASNASFSNLGSGSEQMADGSWRIWGATSVTTITTLTAVVGLSSTGTETISGTGPTYAGVVGSGVKPAWAQAETGTTPTSFIDTPAGDATRAADVVSIDTVPSGTTALRFVFDDGTTQDVTQAATTNYAIPTSLNRKQISKIVAIGSGAGTASGTVSGASTSTGTAAQTLATVTQTAAGKVTTTAGASQTLATVTQAAAAKVIITGGASQALATITQIAGSASVSVGSAAQTLGAVTQTASGRVTVTGYAAAGLATVTQTAGGTVNASQGNSTNGGANQTLDGIRQFARGDHYDPGNPWLYAKQQRERRAREAALKKAEAKRLQVPLKGGAGQTLDGVAQYARAVTYAPRQGYGYTLLDDLTGQGGGYVLPVIPARAHGVLDEMTAAGSGYVPTFQQERDMLLELLRDSQGDNEDLRQWLSILAG